MLTTLNSLSNADFLSVTGGPLEGELWLAERVLSHRPFETVNMLISAFETVIQACTENEKIKLIASHPDLAPKVSDNLSATSQQEQAAAGLTTLTSQEFERFQQLNSAYRAKFGFPFVICARENTKATILEQFALRQDNSKAQEIEIGVGEVLKIIRLRIIDLIDTSES